jgi:hypothetical protein
MKTDNFQLSDDAERQLTEIFTPQYMDAVKAACRRYLRESAAVPENKKEVVVADAKTLEEIANKARELRKLLKNSNRALKRVNLHMMDEYKKTGVLMDMIHLQDELRTLENMCIINPSFEIAETSKKGRLPGSTNTAQRAFAFCLWEIYRQAHGKPAKRAWNEYAGREDGPLVKATRILGPSLGLGSDLAKEFRKIGEQFNGQKIKKHKMA